MSSLTLPSVGSLIFKSSSSIIAMTEAEKEDFIKCKRYFTLLKKMEKITDFIAMIGSLIGGYLAYSSPPLGLGLIAATLLIGLILIHKRETIYRHVYNISIKLTKLPLSYNNWKLTIDRQLEIINNYEKDMNSCLNLEKNVS